MGAHGAKRSGTHRPVLEQNVTHGSWDEDTQVLVTVNGTQLQYFWSAGSRGLKQNDNHEMYGRVRPRLVALPLSLLPRFHGPLIVDC
jgi:hypothetical protein